MMPTMASANASRPEMLCESNFFLELLLPEVLYARPDFIYADFFAWPALAFINNNITCALIF